MAKAICANSGLELEISYFPYSFSKGEITHPIFQLNTRQLLGLLPKWTGRELTEIDTRLYFLALLNSTNLVEFRTYARPSPAICEKNMEPLVKIASWIYSIKNPAVTLAKFAITTDTANLENIHHWISIWYENRADFENGYRKQQIARDRVIREAALEKLIKTPGKTPENYANTLAEWAALAGDFPKFRITVNNKVTTIDQYWKDIIRRCGTNGNIWKIDSNDIQELLEHCEDYIEAGTIYSNSLFRLLRGALKRQDGFMMMVEDDDIEKANIASIIASAPTHKPIESEYETNIAYLRAKNAWNLAEKQRLVEAELARKNEIAAELSNYIDDSSADIDEDSALLRPTDDLDTDIDL